MLVKRLSPKTIIVYGAAPDDIFKDYKDAGIKIISFESDFSKYGKQSEILEIHSVKGGVLLHPIYYCTRIIVLRFRTNAFAGNDLFVVPFFYLFFDCENSQSISQGSLNASVQQS